MKDHSFFYKLAVKCHAFAKDGLLKAHAAVYGIDIQCPYCRQHFSYANACNPEIPIHYKEHSETTFEIGCPQCDTVVNFELSKQAIRILNFRKGETYYYAENV